MEEPSFFGVESAVRRSESSLLWYLAHVHTSPSPVMICKTAGHATGDVFLRLSAHSRFAHRREYLCEEWSEWHFTI